MPSDRYDLLDCGSRATEPAAIPANAQAADRVRTNTVGTMTVRAQFELWKLHIRRATL
jgi:hypothetical protein